MCVWGLLEKGDVCIIISNNVILTFRVGHVFAAFSVPHSDPASMLTPGDFQRLKGRAPRTQLLPTIDRSHPLIDTAESLLDWCKHCSSVLDNLIGIHYRLHFLRDTMPKVVTALAQRDYNDSGHNLSLQTDFQEY